jgi:cell volume regulation protein A
MVNMDIAPAILFVGALVFLAHMFTGLFSRTKIPDVLLLMVIGLALGPALGLVQPSDFGSVGSVFATITLIVILFQSGLDLRLSVLLNAMRGAVMLTTVNFFVTMGVVGTITHLLTGIAWTNGLILGAILGGTSSAVVIPMLEYLGMRKETKTTLYLESALSDVLCIVIVIALIESQKLGSLNMGLIGGRVLSSFLLAALIGVGGAFGWSIILNKVRHLQNSIFTTPAFVFIMFGISEMLGYSGAIAALAFGVTIGNIEFFRRPLPSLTRFINVHPIALNDTEKLFFSEVVFLLKTFFFIYIGLSIHLTNAWYIYIGVIITVIIFMLRIPVVWASMPRTTPRPDMSLTAAIVPKGLAAAVLASMPIQQGIAGGQLIESVTYSVVLFSIFLCSLLVFLLEKTRVMSLYCWMFPEFKMSAEEEPVREESTVIVTPPAET